MPSNSEIAIWLGWERVKLTPAEYVKIFTIAGTQDMWVWNKGKEYLHNPPDWLGDPWRWVEVQKAIITNTNIRITYGDTPEGVGCMFMRAHMSCSEIIEFGADDRQAFLSAFEAWWPERGE